MPTSTGDHHDARALLAGLLPEQRLALLHLVFCRRCGAEMERELAATVRGEVAALVPPRRAARGVTEGELDAMFTRAEASSRGAEELAALPAGDALRAIAAEARFRDPGVATALLLKAEVALDDPAGSARLGEAAFAILSAQDSDPHGRNFSKLCRSLWMIVRGARLERRLEKAEDAFRRGLPFLGAAPAVSEGRAALLAGVAQVRWAERRLDEAAAVFAQAARMFGELGERQGEAACRAQAGCVLVEQLDPWRAQAELAVCHLCIDAELAPALAVRVALMLAWCLVAVGRTELGRERLRAARKLYARAPGRGEEVFRAWWEARIAALGGAGEGGGKDGQAGDAGETAAAGEADGMLDAVRRRLFAEGSVAEAARCSLELLALRVEEGRLDALSELGPDMLRELQNRPSAFRPAEMIDLLAFLAVEESARYAPALAAARHYLSGLRPHPKDRQDLIVDVQVLADRLLVAARPEQRGLAGLGKGSGAAGE
jgi:hypothetical protein